MDDVDLLQRTDALRALARGLLRDPDDAEDIVQDAWVAALEAGERPRNLMAWLRGTTRRLVARAARGRERRRRRELAAARPEAIRTDAAAEADVLRALAAEMARLEEPYRTVLVLRYYRDLRPPAIAASLGIPLATVKTRLRRGLAILRARLSREHRSWAVVLAPLATRPARVGLAIGALGACGAALVLAIGAAPGHAPETRGAGLVAVEPSGREEASGGPGAEEDARRVRADVLVEGPAGPVAGALVKIAPLDRFTETTGAETDALGVARFDPAAEGAYEVRVDAPGFVGGGAFVRFPGEALVRLRSGCRLRLRLDPWPDLGWGAFRWSACGGARNRDLDLDAKEIDAGVWPEGIVEVSYYPTGGGESRSIRIALPAGGEVVHELSAPVPDTTAIEVFDAETGGALSDWTATLTDPWTGEPRALPRKEGSRPGVFLVTATNGSLLSIRADGYARSFVQLPRTGEAPLRVGLRRGTTLRIAFAPTARPREVRIYYNSPAGMGYGRTHVLLGNPIPAGKELNLTEESWEAAYLACTVTEADAWCAAGVPPEARLDVVGLDDAGIYATRQVETGQPGSEMTVELSWPQTVRHRFLVHDREGKAVADAQIRILDAGRKAPRDIVLGSIRTDASGRGSVCGLRIDGSYIVELIHRGGSVRQRLTASDPDQETLLIAIREEPRTRRVLVLDDAGDPVAGARVQFGAREGFGTFAITGDDGIAVGELQPGSDLYLVGVCLEPGGGSELATMLRPPADDPIIYRGDLGKVRVCLEIEGEGLVEAKLRLRSSSGQTADRPRSASAIEIPGTLQRELNLKVHVHGRGTAAFPLRVEPGEYVVEATLGSRSTTQPLVVRGGEPAVVRLSFDR